MLAKFCIELVSPQAGLQKRWKTIHHQKGHPLPRDWMDGVVCHPELDSKLLPLRCTQAGTSLSNCPRITRACRGVGEVTHAYLVV